MHWPLGIISSAQSSGYFIEGSGLFDGSTSVLKRTFGTATSTTKFTIEGILKRSELIENNILLSTWDSSNVADIHFVGTGGTLRVRDQGSSGFNYITNQTFNDIGAYYQIIVTVDLSISAADRVKIFVNGVRITSFSTATTAGTNAGLFNSAREHEINRNPSGTHHFGGYTSRVTFIDGQALTPSSFGETTDDGYWQINDASELTFGNNGFLLEGQSIAAGTNSNVTGYSPGSVVFSGTPYITRGADLTGIADGNTGLISAWVKFGSDGSSEYLWGATTDNNEIQVYRRSDNTLWVNIQDTGNNGDLFLKTSETITVASGWTHLLISWDVSAGYSDIYINDSQSSLSLDTTTSGGLDYTHSNHNFFASDSGDSSEVFNGEAADFWLTVNQTRFELTTESNRRKFINRYGYAVDLGSDGSTPTGTAPLVFFHLDRGEAATAFFANAGTGGTTSLSSSSLTEGSDPNGRHFTPVGTITATNDSPTNGDA